MEYSNDCKRMNIKILPPDINESRTNFTISDDNIPLYLLIDEGFFGFLK